MEIKQIERKDKIITFFGDIKNNSVEAAVKDIVRINLQDAEYIQKCIQWGKENKLPIETAELTPITFMLSTYGGNCYDGLALYDTLAHSSTPVEVVCSGKIMSMGIIILLASNVRKAYRNTTFMIHQVSGVAFGTLRELEESVEEVNRINNMLFNIIREKTKITQEQLDDVLKYKRDWFITAEEALNLGIITEII